VTGNGARFADAPLVAGGTSATEWLSAPSLHQVNIADCPGLVVVAPHPDDETLGLGATIAQLSASGVDVTVVSVTDGGGAYPGLSASEQTQLEFTRRGELQRAAVHLGVSTSISLGLPDGQVSANEDELAAMLTDVLRGQPPGTWCAATWRGDGHPDHEAVGRAAARAADATGAVFVEYPVWMWHWAGPADPAVPWERAVKVPLTPSSVERKRQAAQCFQSQLGSWGGHEPLLPPYVLPRLIAVGEVLFR
jgi:LmbE family N-acetylglucosaminyl deacetylase